MDIQKTVAKEFEKSNKEIMRHSREERRRRKPEKTALRSTSAKFGDRSVLRKTLERLKPKKILQVGLESTDAIQIMLQMGGYLKKLKHEDSSLIYAVARNPGSYLSAIRAAKDSKLAGLIQVLLGLSIARDDVGPLSVKEKQILCGDAHVERNGSNIGAFKYLPDRLIARILDDLDYKPDLVVFCVSKDVAFSEIKEILKLLRAPAFLLVTNLSYSDERRLLKLLPIPEAFPKSIKIHNPKGILLYVSGPGERQATTKAEKENAANPGESPRNIAIVLVEHFGDIVACEPVTRYIRSIYPEAHITWITKEIYRELVEDNPQVDEVLTVGCITEWNLLSRSGIYDKIIDLHIDNRECPICSLPVRKWRPRREVTLDSYYNHGPLLPVFSKYAGLPRLDDAPRVYIPDRVRARVDALSLPKEFIVFHCYSNEFSRDWADEKWLALSQRLKEVWGGTIVEIGTKSCLAERTGTNVIDLCNRVSILESAEVIRRARVFVGVDSGPAHLGNAVGTYGIILLGDYKAFHRYVPFTGDYASGKNAKLLYAKNGPARRIGVSRLLKEIIQALKKTPSASARTTESEDPRTHSAITDPPGGDPDNVRLIAFYLPQFHPILENDRWWGKGFTDWRNVMQGKPLFEDHYQPHLPGELGFYDLRIHDVMCRQAEMAKRAGIAGFCFWHYWFRGKLLLEQPLLKLLESGQPDFPFCLAWANENWTRRWDGQENAVLMQQDYGGPKDDQKHFAWLAQFFRDRRYVTVQGRPLLLIYRPFHMKDAAATITRWRNMARREGIPDLFVMAIRTNFDSRVDVSVMSMGFDGEVAFQPNSPNTHFEILNLTKEIHTLFPDLYSEEIRLLNNKGATVGDYDQAWPIMARSPIVQRASSTCVVPSWDNSARRVNQGAFILDNSTPPSYQRWLRYEIGRCLENRHKPQILFLNAWNEWAEGNHLEPDLKYGDGFLEATRRALQKGQKRSEKSRDNLERATKIALFQPLIRRIVQAIHRGTKLSGRSVNAELEQNLLERITEILAAVEQGRSKQKNEPLISVIREFLKFYPATPLLTQLYNQASALMLEEKKEVAELLFSLLADVTNTVMPELCGKSHYKLALLSQNRDQTVRHLTKCVLIYPEHRAATELLDNLTKKQKNGGNPRAVPNP